MQRMKGLLPLLAIAVPAIAGAQSYEIIRLRHLSDPYSRVTFKTSLNNLGQVLIESGASSGTYQNYVWSEGTTTTIGNLGNPASFSVGLNDAGDVLVTGRRTTNILAPGNSQAAIYRPGQPLVELPGIPGGTISSTAVALGDGVALVSWNPGSGTVTNIVDLTTAAVTPISGLSTYWAINSAGTIVGSVNSQPAMRKADGTVIQFGSIGGATAFPASNLARVVLPNNVVYGNISGPGAGTPSGNPNNTWFRWEEGVGYTLLGAPFNRTGEIYGANTLGQAVGYGSDGSRQWAMLHQNGQFVALETLIPAGTGWQLNQAYGINDQGWIVGNGTIGGQSSAFLLRPILPTTPLSGTIELSGLIGDEAGQTVVFTVVKNGSTVDTESVVLGAGGEYSFAVEAEGVVTIYAKGSHWLRRGVAATLVAGTPATANFVLTNGDVDGSNRVDLDDFLILAAQYELTPPTDLRADLNGDGAVNLDDFLILAGNYEMDGD